MPKLGVNIDHVATVRQARRTYEPDPVWAAAEAELGGADQITVHLREDRRHIQDRDARKIREVIRSRLNLELIEESPTVVRVRTAMHVKEGGMAAVRALVGRHRPALDLSPVCAYEGEYLRL